MTLKGGTSQACAACKYQRRRCTPNCQLAPYFPADQPKMFQNAHRLFGVSNILKILKQLDPSQKMVAMRSIIYQANIRDKYPVYGCLGIVQQLLYQIQLAEEELKAVHAQLSLYKQHQHQHQQEISNNNNNNNNTNDSTTLSDPMSQLQLGLMSMSPPNSSNVGLPLFHHHHDNDNNNNNIIDPLQYNSTGTTVPELLMGSNLSYTTSSNGYMDSKESNNNNNNNNNSVANALWIQHQQSFNDLMHPSSQFITTTNPLQPQQQQYEIEEAAAAVVQDYDDMHPFFDTIEDRRSYIDSKEAYDSSSESSLKDTIQSIEHVAENELKSAAACFTLTSVN